MRTEQTRINGRIRVPRVRVILEDGEQAGIMPTEKALEVAQEHGLDLVEVAPNADPPVCRIMNYGKYKYQQSKRNQQARRKQHQVEVKEVKLRVKTDVHDYNFKARHVERFLKQGNKAKVTIMFRGREVVHADRGREILDQMAEEMSEIGTVEQQPKLEGRNMVMILAPRVPSGVS